MVDIYKSITEEIKFIEDLSKTRQVKLSGNKKLKPKSAYLKKLKPKGFILETTSADRSTFDTGDLLKLSVTGKQFSFKTLDAYVKSVGASFTSTRNTHRSKIHIFSFQGKQTPKNKKAYSRIVLPIKTGLDFNNLLQDQSYTHDGGYHTRGLITVTLNNKLFDLFIVRQESKNYLVIDSLEKSTLEDFSDLSWSIVVSIGYLTGHLAQDESYTFSYRNKRLNGFSNFTYTQRRTSLKSFYTPVNANPYAWIKSDRKLGKSFYGKINEINAEQLSKLCQLVHGEIDIKAIILLITESLTRSLILMPAGLSVALEGMSEYFVSNNPEALTPLRNKGLAEKFRKDLMEVLKKYEAVDGFAGHAIMQAKIQNINSPTNREKLKAPFTILDIPLTTIDEEILEYRNDFLHGNINLKPQKGKKTYSMDSFEISLRILTLLNMVIMKMIGYKGYIINHVKTQEPGLRKIIDEPYYREI